MLITLFLLSLFFLLELFCLSSLCYALRFIPRREFPRQIKLVSSRFFYAPIHNYFFPKFQREGLLFALSYGQNIARFFFSTAVVTFLFATPLFSSGEAIDWFWVVITFFAACFIFFIVGDYFPRILGNSFPTASLRLCGPVGSIILVVIIPLVYPFLKISTLFSRSVYLEELEEIDSAKEEIIEIIQQSDVSPSVNLHDKELIESVLTFRNRIAREVMVPRVDMFSLPVDMPIKEAAKLLESEGYSRVPVYRNSVDNIVGVLMYKDILERFEEYEEKGNDPAILAAPIETIQKGVLYTPETKRISELLQEFRKKQIHLAIVVDEYGGTEGIVTIEDILEEIVGEIADEYDEEEEELFSPQTDGSWLVDARMGINDAAEQLGISFPHDADYDTIGGYIYHLAGAIPQNGFVIHQDEFMVEVVESNERCVEKVRIIAVNKNEAEEEF